MNMEIKGSRPRPQLRIETNKAQGIVNQSERMITEQLLPSPNGSRYQSSSTLKKDSYGDINLRVLLLAPWPEDTPPFAKSLIYLCSQTGTIRTEVNRLPGVSDHFFRLYVISRESDVSVALPANFQGSVTIEQRGMRRDKRSSSNDRVRLTDSFRAAMQAGVIRLNPTDAYEDEDEVYVTAPGRIDVSLLDASPQCDRPVWRAVDGRRAFRRLKHVLRLIP